MLMIVLSLISSLLFADGAIVFYGVDMAQAGTLKQILIKYEQALG